MFRCFKSTKLDEFSLSCSLADLKNDSFREQPSQQIIVKYFSEFFHTFLLAAWRIHTVISTLFGNNFLKKKRKKIIEDKRLQSLFL